jgi:NDP-sugar pyrophosphorylase family protein
MTSESINSPTLLVLAAGLGSRYGGLKQLEQIGPAGETLMDYSIHDAKNAGFSRVIFLIREEMREQFEAQVGSKYEGILEVRYAYQDKNDLPAGFACPPERERPWGTGHAVWAARDALGDNSFAVINADDFYGAETFEVLIQSFQKMDQEEDNNLFSMVGFRLSETLSEHGVVSRGICQESDGYLESVEEWTKIGGTPLVGLTSDGTEGSLQGTEIVSMNVWGFPPAVIKLLEKEFIRFLEKKETEDLTSEFYLPAAVDAGIHNGEAKVLVYPASCSWMGVTYQEDKDRVIESIAGLVAKVEYKTPLFS